MTSTTRSLLEPPVPLPRPPQPPSPCPTPESWTVRTRVLLRTNPWFGLDPLSLPIRVRESRFFLLQTPILVRQIGVVIRDSCPVVYQTPVPTPSPSVPGRVRDYRRPRERDSQKDRNGETRRSSGKRGARHERTFVPLTRNEILSEGPTGLRNES